MKNLALVCLIVLATSAPVMFSPAAIVQNTPSAQSPAPRERKEQRNARLIANIEHNGLRFKVAIDDADESFLKIHIPEEDRSFAKSERPVVRLKVLMRNDKVIEGRAEPTPGWVGSGGYVDVTYRFGLGKRTVVDEIHSVTIWIGAERYTLFPF